MTDLRMMKTFAEESGASSGRGLGLDRGLDLYLDLGLGLGLGLAHAHGRDDGHALAPVLDHARGSGQKRGGMRTTREGSFGEVVGP